MDIRQNQRWSFFRKRISVPGFGVADILPLLPFIIGMMKNNGPQHTSMDGSVQTSKANKKIE